jgi:hypothetical protein
MNIQREANGDFNIKCSHDELIIISNALNNIPQAVSENEYTTLIGASKAETKEVLNIVSTALNSL